MTTSATSRAFGRISTASMPFFTRQRYALRVAQEPRECLEVLVDGTFNVLQACVEAGIKRVVAASSASIYGMADVFPTPESHAPYNNRTWYGAAKVLNETLLRSFNDMYGLNYVALRYFNVYGPRMDVFGKYTEVLIRWLDCLDNRVSAKIFGDGKQTMDFVYVDDIARANLLAMQSDVTDEVFNVASGTETSLLGLLEALLRVVGREDVAPEFGPERAVNPVPRRLADTTKAARMLGFRSQVGLDEGLRRLVAWRKEVIARGQREAYEGAAYAPNERNRCDMNTILITGTTGFVGGALVRSLGDSNRIIELNRSTVGDSADSFVWNFRDPLPTGLPTKTDIVIHSAADTSESQRDGFATNVAATSALLEYARAAGASAFVYLSTGSVYGGSASPHQERQPIFPVGVYACTKAAGEFVVQSYQNCFRTLILRLYFPFGPEQRKERLIPRLIHRVSHGETIPLKGSSGPTISPLYVDDLTQWVALLLESDAKGTFNLAGNEPHFDSAAFGTNRDACERSTAI